MKCKNFACRICGGEKYSSIFSTQIPLSGQVCEDVHTSSKLYPLHVVACKTCGHVQLQETLNIDLYTDYLYTPSYAKQFQEYISKFVSIVDAEYGDVRDKKVLEIGSSNGALLSVFKAKGWKVLGIEPSQILSDIAASNGIETLCRFFDETCRKEIHDIIGIPNIVILRHVLEHLDNLPQIMHALDMCIRGGDILIEVPYLGRIIKEEQFYAFFHEHLSYFSVRSLRRLLDTIDFHIFQIDENDLEGGSILIRARKNIDNTVPSSRILEKYIQMENAMISPNGLMKFSRNINSEITRFKNMVLLLVKHGFHLAAWGAGQRGCTLLNICNLCSDEISYIIDANKNYWWKYVAGTDIQIVPPEYYLDNKVDKILIFATGYADSIIEENKEFIEQGGEFIKII